MNKEDKLVKNEYTIFNIIGIIIMMFTIDIILTIIYGIVIIRYNIDNLTVDIFSIIGIGACLFAFSMVLLFIIKKDELIDDEEDRIDDLKE